MGVLKQAHFAEKMRCAIILFICILASASSPTAADEHYNHIVPEEEYQEPNDVHFSVDDDILTESPLGSLAPCAGVMKSHAKAQQHENSVVPLFAGALAQQKEVCLAEEKANKRKEEEKKEMGSFTGPTFKFEVEPCKGGNHPSESEQRRGDLEDKEGCGPRGVGTSRQNCDCRMGLRKSQQDPQDTNQVPRHFLQKVNRVCRRHHRIQRVQRPERKPWS